MFHVKPDMFVAERFILLKVLVTGMWFLLRRTRVLFRVSLHEMHQNEQCRISNEILEQSDIPMFHVEHLWMHAEMADLSIDGSHEFLRRYGSKQIQQGRLVSPVEFRGKIIDQDSRLESPLAEQPCLGNDE